MWLIKNNQLIQKRLFSLLILLLPIQLGKHFWPKFSYVMGLRVDYLAPTIYLTDILIFLLLAFWLVAKPKFTIYNLQFTITVFGFLALNCFLAKNQPVAFFKLLKLAELCCLGFYISKNRYSRLTISYLLPIALVYTSFIVIIQFLKQSSLNGFLWFLGERTFNAGTPGIAKIIFFNHLLMRPYATFSHPNSLAGFLLVSLILTFPYWWKRNRFLAINYSLLTVSAIIVSFSQSIWLIGSLVLFIWLWQFKKWRIISGLLVFSFFAFLVRPNQLSIFQRLELNQVAWQLVKQHPLIGVGLNNFIVYLPNLFKSIEPTFWLQPVHNIYLLIASETGLIGLFIFLIFIYATLKKLCSMSYVLCTSLCAILALGFVDHYWLTLQQNQLLLAIVFGLAWNRNDKKHPNFV